ncbi:MAG TPA: M14 family zinc carboxypeptidase, partial [Gemmatimonadaceae bacterium]|nr:M14 family zinc carboxypeptidase [Gemmatimonadaceae bacterium]
MHPSRLALVRRTLAALAFAPLALASAPAQQLSLDTRDPAQKQDASFERDYKAWIVDPRFGSPLVDHLPVVPGIPMPKDVLGYHIGAPRTLTYYADQLKYYRALAAASPRVMVESIGTSDEGRELVVIWISSEANMAKLQQNRDNLKKLSDPRGMNETQVKQLIGQTKPHYHFMGGLHSGETGPSEMLMELAYRLAVETSPLINQIRDQLYVSITPVADADGRDRNVDWFYRGLEVADAQRGAAGGDSAAGPRAGGGRGIGAVPYWGKYAYHDNNRDINIILDQMRAIVDWYFTAHPPIMHDLHESLSLLYTYSGAAPQNPNLDPILFAELPWFANWELAQMTKYGMPGVYTHAFMDGWSPGYLGSVAYNHNGLMKMYETQSGRDLDSAAVARARAALAGGPTRANATAQAGGRRGEGARRGGLRGRGRAAAPRRG